MQSVGRTSALFRYIGRQANARPTSIHKFDPGRFDSTSDRRSSYTVCAQNAALALQPLDCRKRNAGSLREISLLPSKERSSCANELAGKLDRLDTFIII